MRKIIVVLALLATPAFAADLPYKSAPPMNAAVYQQSSWTGFYLGINGGGGWALSDQGVPGFGSVSTTGSGGVIGGTFGYNYQLNNNFVLGLETDLDWANIGGSGAVGPVTGAS